MANKKSFFERLTGSLSDEDVIVEEEIVVKKNAGWAEEEEEGQLTVDVYQTPTHIIVETMVAGVKPDDITIDIARDMITIKGKRSEAKMIQDENYFTRELYWGSFSRTILLPQEVEPEDSEAVEKHGLLTIKIPKVDKSKRSSVKVKSI